MRLIAAEHGWAELRGQYVAAVAAGDILHPLRLARQVAALEASPAAPLAGCGAWRFDGVAVQPDALGPDSRPDDLGWLVHLAEPAALSSILARTDAARAAGAAAGWLGAVLRLLSPMDVAPPVYVPARLHISRAPVRDAAPSLAAAYEPLLGDEAGHAAT
ncbi:MAG: hypothetical protein M3Y22_05935, partial [Pseudomonadota bacterium]|nr:hypothetical protein [Pseudomonadota bacterium]